MQPNYLGEKLRILREKRRLGNLKDAGKKLSVSNNTLGSYERGEVLPDVDYLAMFAEKTGADFNELLYLRLASGKNEAARKLALTINLKGSQELNVPVTEEEQLILDREQRKQEEKYRKGIDLMFDMSKDDPDYNPAGVWSGLILELVAIHGLQASGSKRILEVLNTLKQRNKDRLNTK